MRGPKRWIKAHFGIHHRVKEIWLARGREFHEDPSVVDGFENRSLSLRHSFFQRVHSNINAAKRKSTILDFGCGTGRYLKFLEDHTDDSVKLYGIDISESVIENYTKGQVRKAEVVCGLLWRDELFEKDLRFDVIYSFSSLQYLLPSQVKAFAAYCGEKISVDGEVHLYFPTADDWPETFRMVTYLRYPPEWVSEQFQKHGFVQKSASPVFDEIATRFYELRLQKAVKASS